MRRRTPRRSPCSRRSRSRRTRTRPGLRTAVSNNLTYRVQRRVESQILAGTGHENGQIQGILEMTGVGSVAYSATELEADQTLEGIVTVLLSDAVPNFVALHPRDWANMLK